MTVIRTNDSNMPGESEVNDDVNASFKKVLLNLTKFEGLFCALYLYTFFNFYGTALYSYESIITKF